jgi:hypothetical protein
VCRQHRIEGPLAERHMSDGWLVHYDEPVRTLRDGSALLSNWGTSEMEEKGKLQIVIGLLCDAEGCSASVPVFEGNTGDPRPSLPRFGGCKNDLA